MLCELLDKVELVLALAKVSPLVDFEQRYSDLNFDKVWVEFKFDLTRILADLLGVVAPNQFQIVLKALLVCKNLIWSQMYLVGR